MVLLYVCRYKWDAVRSIIKSAAGWQSRKVQELERGPGGAAGGAAGAAAGGEDEAGMAKAGGLRKNLKTWLGIGRWGWQC